MHDDDQRIREKAYELWVAAGRPEGQHLDHWVKAKTAGSQDSEMPAAGPLAKPELTNPDATPGSGMFPEAGDENDTNAQPSG